MPRDADQDVCLGIFVRVAALQLEGKDIFCANKWHNMHTMEPIETGDGTDLCRPIGKGAPDLPRDPDQLQRLDDGAA